ncbi:flavodoxin [Acetivibrio clariflavus]|uniref:Flavodoxin n=1 Tax=Acetivibrio clariflavus (strain DSM 19732 / NBRC 101661 / EBR45) TaxID=720554 RepID=G8LWI8_ACECE|nr:flavodoxin [Acetivibrio clariflavus]AEV67614.1 flavodoxin, short chain [Acetivibrio clariflavus DSM 19732]
MKKISIIYWSGTGNTQKMAEAVAEGAREGGNEVKLLSVDSASKEDVLNSDAVAFGCPSMGCEQLEEIEMEPFICEIEKENISGKPVALFGSYDWGDGQWMRDWEDRMKASGVNLIAEGLTIQNTPDDDGLKRCKELGKKLSGI